MSHLSYFNDPAAGKHLREAYNFSQSVRVGPNIHLSGQGGWNEKLEFAPDLGEHLEQAYLNVETALRAAGVESGWEGVWSVRSYHCPMNEEAFDKMVELNKKYMPNHAPIWTCVGVAALALPPMMVEIEVIAHVQE